jgi:hypothetical protein
MKQQQTKKDLQDLKYQVQNISKQNLIEMKFNFQMVGVKIREWELRNNQNK